MLKNSKVDIFVRPVLGGAKTQFKRFTEIHNFCMACFCGGVELNCKLLQGMLLGWFLFVNYLLPRSFIFKSYTILDLTSNILLIFKFYIIIINIIVIFSTAIIIIIIIISTSSIFVLLIIMKIRFFQLRHEHWAVESVLPSQPLPTPSMQR